MAEIFCLVFNSEMISSPGLFHPHTLTLCISTVLFVEHTQGSNLKAFWERKANQHGVNFWVWLVKIDYCHVLIRPGLDAESCQSE